MVDGPTKVQDSRIHVTPRVLESYPSGGNGLHMQMHVVGLVSIWYHAEHQHSARVPLFKFYQIVGPFFDTILRGSSGHNFYEQIHFLMFCQVVVLHTVAGGRLHGPTLQAAGDGLSV